jgi:hypothetical protein
MWKLAQRNLLQGKAYRSTPRQYTFERTCYLATKSNTSSSTQRDAENGSPRSYKRQHRQVSKPMSNVEDAKRFFESTKGFLGQSSTTESSWTREHLGVANKILHTWSRQTIPRELQPSWIEMADQLISTALDQYQLIETFNQQSSTNLIPDSTVFCNIITTYSKSNLPHSAERADYWLQKMIQTSYLYPDRVTPPRATLFANVLSAWEKSRHPDAEARAEMIWKQLKSTKGLTPTSSAYYLFISLWSKSDLPEAAEMAETILREMVKEGRRNPKLLPSCPIFVNVISAWRRKEGNDKNNAERAQAVLDLLVKEHTRRNKLAQKWLRFSINDVPFNVAIDAWVKSSAKSELVEERVDNILKTMGDLKVDCTMVTAWSALPLYSPRDVGETTKTVQHIPAKLLRLLDLSLSNNGGGKNPKLQSQIFTKALEICSAYSVNGKEDSSTAAEMAEEIFLNRYFKRPRGERRVETTIAGFEHCIQAWKNDQKHNIEYKEQRIVELLQKMEKEVDHIYMHTHKRNPSVGKLYASLAKTWAMSYYPSDALKRASCNINRLLASSKAQPNFKPSPFWFQDIIQVTKENYSEGVAADFVKDVYSKLLANDTRFFRMMKDLEVPQTPGCDPSLIMEEFLNGVLDTLVSSSSVDAGRRAEMVLLKQQELYEDGNCLPPTFETFKKVLDCWSNSQENGAAERMENMLLLANSLYDDGDTMLRPDFDGFMSVITAWSKSRTPDAPDKIQSHLKTLYQRRLEGDQTFTIDSRVYAALIRAYKNSGRGDSQTMAYSIFESAPDDLKDTSLYNLLIEAQGGDSSRAEELLQIMHMSYFEGNDNVKPNTETFNAVIQTWLRSGSPMAAWRADGIFKRMEEMSTTGKLDVKPNSRTFDLVISALAQEWGAELGKVDVYLALLKQHYLAGECVPTVTSYTEAIRAWASKNDDPRAILRAQALLDEMYELVREGVDTMRPNRDTYEVYLEGVGQSSFEDRTQLINDVLFKMKENEFDLDNDLRSSIQRCLLPVSSRANSWIVNVDNDYINPNNEWIQSNSM